MENSKRYELRVNPKAKRFSSNWITEEKKKTILFKNTKG